MEPCATGRAAIPLAGDHVIQDGGRYLRWIVAVALQTDSRKLPGALYARLHPFLRKQRHHQSGLDNAGAGDRRSRRLRAGAGSATAKPACRHADSDLAHGPPDRLYDPLFPGLSKYRPARYKDWSHPGLSDLQPVTGGLAYARLLRGDPGSAGGSRPDRWCESV